DYTLFINFVEDVFLHEVDGKEDEIKGKVSEDIFDVVWAKVEKAYETQKANIQEQYKEFERIMLLCIIDGKWTDHNDTKG
ncbi:hypothetical protein EIG99_13910, partial [Staphylococcus condimenti]